MYLLITFRALVLSAEHLAQVGRRALHVDSPARRKHDHALQSRAALGLLKRVGLVEARAAVDRVDAGTLHANTLRRHKYFSVLAIYSTGQRASITLREVSRAA